VHDGFRFAMSRRNANDKFNAFARVDSLDGVG